MRTVLRSLLVRRKGTPTISLLNYPGLVFLDQFQAASYPVLTSLDATASSDGSAKRVIVDTENKITIEGGPSVDSLSEPTSGTTFKADQKCHVRLTFTAE